MSDGPAGAGECMKALEGTDGLTRPLSEVAHSRKVYSRLLPWGSESSKKASPTHGHLSGLCAIFSML